MSEPTRRNLVRADEIEARRIVRTGKRLEVHPLSTSEPLPLDFE